MLSLAGFAKAETFRIATFNVELHRKGPGLLLRDIERGKDTQIRDVIEVIARTNPDILVLQGFDWDYENRALDAFRKRLKQAGVVFNHLHATQPNTGMATGLDMDGDGYRGDASDAQGFGRFTGQGGVAVLSRFALPEAGQLDFTHMLWRDMPKALLPKHPDGRPFPSAEAMDIQRLSSTVHWVLPVRLSDEAMVWLLVFQAGPPVFDGPEDRNGRRNHDEILFWTHFLDGDLGAAPDQPIVVAGGANLDPFDADGRHDAINALLTHPRLQDPRPKSVGGALADDQGHLGPNALDTVDWPHVGRLRVDYLLPSRELRVIDSGVFWPEPADPAHTIASGASRHRLVWIDLALP
ncbi:MAG: endonuclease/exonuclease/phosphatase family protein [Arenibacterium sp.]